MTVICMDCEKVIREKAPFEDKSKSHGICDICLKIRLDEIKELKSNK